MTGRFFTTEAACKSCSNQEPGQCLNLMGKEKGPNRNVQSAWKGGNSLSIREEENYWSVFWEFQGVIFVVFHFCLELTLNTSICLLITRSSVVVLLLCVVTYMLFPSWNDHVCRAESLQACITLCNPMDYSSPACSDHEISQARILEWVAISFSRGSWSSLLRDGTRVSYISWIGRQVLYHYRHQWSTNSIYKIDHQQRPTV